MMNVHVVNPSGRHFCVNGPLVMGVSGKFFSAKPVPQPLQDQAASVVPALGRQGH
jgi:hypothetical protein